MNEPGSTGAASIVVVEAGARILAGLPERISRQATTALGGRGVRVLTDTRVTEILPDGLSTSAGVLPADIVVWSAGIKATQANPGYGLQVNRSNQFVVDTHLRTSEPSVYAIGDCAACVWRDGANVPARAQAAHQQAHYLAKLLVAQRAGTKAVAAFRYRDFGSLVSLGENRGVGNLMVALSGRSFFVGRLIAKGMYMPLHLMHHRAQVSCCALKCFCCHRVSTTAAASLMRQTVPSDSGGQLTGRLAQESLIAAVSIGRETIRMKCLFRCLVEDSDLHDLSRLLRCGDGTAKFA